MDSPVRQQQKRNDYLRHKLFRKINRRRRAKRQQEIEAPVKELRKRLRQKRTFGDGKDGDRISKSSDFSDEQLSRLVVDNSYPDLRYIYDPSDPMRIGSYMNVLEKNGWSINDPKAMQTLRELYDIDQTATPFDHFAFDAGPLPEVTVKPDYKEEYNILLETFYPFHRNRYPLTGHSILRTPGGNEISTGFDDKDYNLILNNCSDATRKALEQAYHKAINPFLFTTPGDVKDFAESELNGRTLNFPSTGMKITKIPANLQQLQQIANYAKQIKNTGKYAGGKDNNITNDDVNEVVEAGKEIVTGAVPFYGTYQDIKTAINEPSLSNISWALASAVSDGLLLSGIGSGLGILGKSLRATRGVSNAVRAVRDANRSYQLAKRGVTNIVTYNAKRNAVNQSLKKAAKKIVQSQEMDLGTEALEWGYKNDNNKWKPTFNYANGKDGEELVELPEVRVDDQGNVIADDGRRGTVRLPDINITTNDPRNYRSAYHPEDVEQAFNLTGAGMLFNPFRLARTSNQFLTNPTFNNAVEIAHDALPWSKAGRFLLGAYGLGNNEGLAKTYDLAKKGEYGRAALSGLGDAFNTAMMIEGGSGVFNTIKGLERLHSSTDFPSAIEYAYNRNPELANIGTINDYERYIKTIFPESKVQSVQYHMGPKGLQELKPSTGDIWNTNPDARGIYVTPEKSYAEKIRKFTTDRLEKPSILTYLRRNITPGGWKIPNEQYTDIYPVMIDIRNPLQTKGTWTWGIKENKYNSLMDQYDGIINSGPRWWQNVNKMPETIVPTTEQTFILGSGEDATKFSNFMKRQSNFDNFFSTLPFGLGLAGYGLSNYSDGKDPGIHIKPENRGKFTRLKKRTGKSTSWFKAHGTPAQKKMATFAMNSKRWHHK